MCVCVYYNGNITISFLHYNTVILHSSDTVFFLHPTSPTTPASGVHFFKSFNNLSTLW